MHKIIKNLHFLPKVWYFLLGIIKGWNMNTQVSTQSSSKKEKRPKSSNAAMLTAAATAYNGMQIKALAKGQQELIQSSKQIYQSSLRQEEIQQSIDYGIRNIEQLNIESNDLSRKGIEIADKAFKLQQLDSQKKDARDKIADAEKDLSKQMEAEIQSFLDITYSINREQQLVLQTSMTILEKFFTLQKLQEIILTVSSGVFKTTADRTYRDETEDSIKAKSKEVRDQFTEQDNIDLQTMIDIEKKDENAEAEKLLENLKNREKMLSEAKALMARVNKRKGLTDSDFKEIKSSIQKIRKVVKV